MSTGSTAGENKETEQLSFRLSFLSYCHTIVSRHEIEDEYIICDVQLPERVNTHPDAERRMIMRSVVSEGKSQREDMSKPGWIARALYLSGIASNQYT